MNDNTFQKNYLYLKRAKQEWESTVDSLPQFICLLDKNQRILRCNRTLEAWKLGEVTSVKDRAVVSLFNDNLTFQQRLNEAWEKLENHAGSAFEIDSLLPGRHYLVQVHPISTQAFRADDPGDSYAVIVISDITEHKNLETQSLEFALEKERGELLRQFITDVSHDFKTPLAIINTSLYLLDKSEDAQRRKTHADRIEQQVYHISKMIDNLLAMVRLSQKPELEFEHLSINTLVEEVLLVMQDEAKEQGHALSLHLDTTLPDVPVEPAEIRQALCSLVENAIHYTRESSIIHLRTLRVSDYVAVEIEDSGMGIAESDLPHIFKRFYRADKARQIETGRAGLGLALVKNIVELHMGKVEVTSEPGKGSCFRVLLPIHPTS